MESEINKFASDLLVNSLNSPKIPTSLEADSLNLTEPSIKKNIKSKSSQRILYEAEVEIFKKKVGDLEQIRTSLGLSQRKICQLLLVDPSAWTRWTKQGEEAPPHIYRSLQWYLGLVEKYPEFKNPYWLATVSNTKDQKSLSWEKDKNQFIQRARKELFSTEQIIYKKIKRTDLINRVILFILVFLIFFLLFK